MKMRKLMAIKPHRYGTRHLTAGEEYEAPPRHAVALVAAKRARFADKLPPDARKFVKFMGAKTITGQIGDQPVEFRKTAEPEPAAEQPPDLDSLRLQATQLGINVDGRWGAARLQHEIEQARQR